ncbi:MAG TPA: outer membrane beta-barrel protein [Bryobacteraceae bacterium]|nr:outer membrane beta-barrel protein [Bryobacteraceae bacterium]
MRTLYVLAILAGACPCFCQSLLLGVKGGARLTDDITGSATSESKRYIIGPAVELQLPLGLGVEFDALYRREGYYSASNYVEPSFQRERANSWEFPILLKYRFGPPVVKPYVAAGYAPRVISGGIDVGGQVCNPVTGACTTFSSHSGTNWNISHGIVLGGGVQVGVGSLRLSPEVRYTRWNNAAINPMAHDPFQSTQNQLDVLLGIAWKVH